MKWGEKHWASPSQNLGLQDVCLHGLPNLTGYVRLEQESQMSAFPCLGDSSAAQGFSSCLHKSNSLFPPNTVCWINWRKARARDFFICWSSAFTTGLSSLAKLRTPQAAVTWRILLQLLFYCIERRISFYKKELLVPMRLCHLLQHFASEGLCCGYWQLQSQTGLLNAFPAL